MSDSSDSSPAPNPGANVPEAEAAAASTVKETSRSPRGKAGLVSIAIMCSRVLGLVRDVVLGGLFGGSRAMDAFMVAYRTPNMLRDLFAEGALSTAFITTLSKTLKTDGDAAAWTLARKMITLVSVFMTTLTIICMILVPIIVRIMALGWTDDPAQIELTIHLARIMYPFIALISLAAIVMGMLNAKDVFFVPAISSSFFNLFSIISGIVIGYRMDPTWGPQAMTGFAIGVVIGGLAQLGIQLPALHKIGFRFFPDFRWKDSGVKKILSLMGPAIIAGGAVQAGVLLNTFFASFLETGSVTYLQFSFRLMQLPIGVFGVAVATVTLPAVSRAATEGISPEFRSTLSRGVRLVLLLTMPSALGLALLAEPIISVVWQRGNFSLADTLAVAGALRCYAIGLCFYAGTKVIQPAFYSIDKKWVPMFVSLLAIAVNAGLNSVWVFVLKLDHTYLALSTAIGSMVNFTILYILMRKFAGNFHTQKLVSTFLRLAFACAALVSVILAARFTILANWQELAFHFKLLNLCVTIGVAAAFYFVTAKILKVEEMDELASMIQRRRRKKS